MDGSRRHFPDHPARCRWVSSTSAPRRRWVCPHKRCGTFSAAFAQKRCSLRTWRTGASTTPTATHPSGWSRRQVPLSLPYSPLSIPFPSHAMPSLQLQHLPRHMVSHCRGILSGRRPLWSTHCSLQSALLIHSGTVRDCRARGDVSARPTARGPRQLLPDGLRGGGGKKWRQSDRDSGAETRR